MYINDLGIGRDISTNGGERITSVNGRSNIARTTDTSSRVNTGSYASAMKKAVETQKTTGMPTFVTAGDIIIQEAFKKMEDDPEWEESVMSKVKEYYAGDYTVNSAQYSYLNSMGQGNLQNYLVQSLIGGQSGIGLGLTGYSPYGVGSLAASAYGSVMNSTINSSLFGNWLL